MSRHLANFLRDESGATAIEYSLLGALIAVVIITAVRSTGLNVSALFNTVAAGVSSR